MNKKITLFILFVVVATTAMAQHTVVQVRSLTNLKDSALFARRIDSLWTALHGNSPLPGVSLEAFGGVSDGVTDNYPAFVAAKAYLKGKNGGIIYLHNGVWLVKTAVTIGQSNITIEGESKDSTILKGDVTAGNTIRLTTTRQDVNYWKSLSDTNYLFTYKNSTKRGDGFIVLKNAAWADSFKLGQNIFIRAGTHYYDQEFGEHNTVIRKHLDTLFLKYNLSRNYSFEQSIYRGELAQSYTIPAIGDTASAYLTSGTAPTATNQFYSIGDNTFLLVSVSGDRCVFKNIGRGNGTGVLAAGTGVSKGRQIIINLHPTNFTLQNLTVLGTSGIARVVNYDNAFHVLTRNVVIKRAPTVPDTSGFTHSVDCTRDVVFENVDFIDVNNTVSAQVSRSTGDARYSNCYFNHPLDVSEMTFNTVIDHSTFNIKDRDFAVRLGKSITSASLTNSTLNVDSVTYGVINMDDIQELVNIQRDGVTMDNNTFHLAKNANVMNVAGGGLNTFTNNRVYGRIGIISSFPNTSSGNVAGADFKTIVTGNYFNGTYGNYLFAIGASGTVSSNDFVNADTVTSGVTGFSGYLFFNNTEDTGAAKNFIFRNNNFKNWYYRTNGQQVNYTIDDHLDIYDNYFTGAKGQAATTDFVWNLHNRSGGGTAQFSDAEVVRIRALLNQSPTVSNSITTTEGQTLTTTEGETIIFN